MNGSLSKSALILVVVAVACGSAATSRAGCCQLVKVESSPPTVHVRVCSLAEGAACSAPLFEGDVAHGSPRSICGPSTEVIYQELDPVSGELGPATTAACSPERNVEL